MKWKGKFFKFFYCDKFWESIVCKLYGNLKFKIKNFYYFEKKNWIWIYKNICIVYDGGLFKFKLMGCFFKFKF